MRGCSPQPEEDKAWMDGVRITWHVSHASTAPRVSGPCLGPVLPGPPPPLGWAPKLPGATTSARIGSSTRPSKSSPGGAKPQAKLGQHKRDSGVGRLAPVWAGWDAH